MRAASAEGVDKKSQIEWSNLLLAIGDGRMMHDEVCSTVKLPGSIITH